MRDQYTFSACPCTRLVWQFGKLPETFKIKFLSFNFFFLSCNRYCFFHFKLVPAIFLFQTLGWRTQTSKLVKFWEEKGVLQTLRNKFAARPLTDNVQVPNSSYCYLHGREMHVTNKSPIVIFSTLRYRF